MAKNKSTFYVSAVYTSPPTTMGGNTKIMLEMIDGLVDRFNFVIFTTEPKTFEKNLENIKKVTVIAIEYPFKKFNYTNHISEIRHISHILNKYFQENKINKEDYFYSCSDFAPDVLSIYNLKKRYEFIWIASLYLFIPNPLENIKQKYGFPFIKYLIYYFYQRYLFKKMLKYADLFLITNDYDKRYFPKNLRNKVFAMYGGVNFEEIENAKRKWSMDKKYDAVFCSRLHPQKGISRILDIWSMVVEELPLVKLAIIGNGEKGYEKFLKDKAEKLGITKNIEWLGYINGIEKYVVYLRSKVFLHGTIYDNNGMVAAEALCTGLPVIMYDLPQLRSLYNSGCLKVANGDLKEYYISIVKLLKYGDANLLFKNTQKNKLMKIWDWKHRILELEDFLGK